MSMPETMAEYLVKLSADVDTNSFNAALTALNGIIAKLKSIKGLAAAGALVAGFAAVGKAATDAIKGVASADMQFRRLANTMWITKDSAKALSVAMKVMGVSEEDIAWIPELREQFFRLRSEMNQLATPRDADQQLKWIREIGYDIQSLQVKLKMLKEWVVYFLIKYLQPFIKEFQDFIRWLNDKLGKNMPQIAKKIAEFLGHIVSLCYTAIKALKTIIGTVYRFIDSLPANVKKWGAVFATVGAFILAGPFGKFIIALGGALILLEDFIYYMNGWNSSKAMAPVWEKLLQFLEGDSLTKAADTVKGFLSWVAEKLDYIWSKFVTGFDWDGAKESLLKGIAELKAGTIDLYDAICELFGKIQESTDKKHTAQSKSFFTELGNAASDLLKKIGWLCSVLGKMLEGLAALSRLNLNKAKEITFETLKMLTAMGIQTFMQGIQMAMPGRSKYSFGSNEKENSTAAMKHLQAAGISKSGAAGIVGNLSAESNVDPSNVQLDKQSDKENYLQRLLNGDMSREDFVSDGIGFGLAQWTIPKRKGALWDYAASQGVPINDMGMQLDFLLKELREDYPSLYEALCNGEISVSDAAYRMLHEFERPQDQSDAVYADRADRSQQVYNSNFAGKGGGGGSFGLNPDSWGLSPKGFASTPPAYSTTSTRNTVKIGDINVHVAGTNASARDIGQAVNDVLDARFGRGQLV